MPCHIPFTHNILSLLAHSMLFVATPESEILHFLLSLHEILHLPKCHRITFVKVHSRTHNIEIACSRN